MTSLIERAFRLSSGLKSLLSQDWQFRDFVEQPLLAAPLSLSLWL